jgi:hypothetical protein
MYIFPICTKYIALFGLVYHLCPGGCSSYYCCNGRCQFNHCCAAGRQTSHYPCPKTPSRSSMPTGANHIIVAPRDSQHIIVCANGSKLSNCMPTGVNQIMLHRVHIIVCLCATHFALFVPLHALSTVAAHIVLKVIQGGDSINQQLDKHQVVNFTSICRIKLQMALAYAVSSCKLRRHMPYQVTNCTSNSHINKISIPVIYQELLQIEAYFYFMANPPSSFDFPLKPLYLKRSPFGLEAAISHASSAATWTAFHIYIDYSVSLTRILQLSGCDSIH